jgi:Flp pilus assembly protein TadG
MRRREEGASAVELAIVTPLLVMLLFGIIGFGLAFLQVQSIRTAVREGGRAAAVGAPVLTTQQTTVRASSGSIPPDQQSNVQAGLCTAQTIGEDVTVSYDTQNLNNGTGIVVAIPLFPNIHLTPVIEASFRCEA